MYTTLRVKKELAKKIKLQALNKNKNIEDMAEELILKSLNCQCNREVKDDK